MADGRTVTESADRTKEAATRAGYPDEATIRERAFQIYNDRVRTNAPGDPTTDWLRAEQELNEKVPTESTRTTKQPM